MLFVEVAANCMTTFVGITHAVLQSTGAAASSTLVSGMCRGIVQLRLLMAGPGAWLGRWGISGVGMGEGSAGPGISVFPFVNCPNYSTCCRHQTHPAPLTGPKPLHCAPLPLFWAKSAHPLIPSFWRSVTKEPPLKVFSYAKEEQ